ncbi:fructosamine kinase family protein [Pseudobacteriovorax antillogorgiicola]|uniref:Fructosamine-3-kinase n=1 Tax=Pseudobacteriovorax antillogorgiicola TaxID=1513793 RepID=A0A1Y6CMZ6_9BACT|nr:fructosamine kinase family protein [Pseudobacteriovorax antillogorgiicola]TCS45021.1 fructosamine-3-kinase [Pseudobacteriovorax antillogorgiicola]SMF76320.1 Fructosamine-3-kinase [Pseudobacteriovorax antillogorgiicola]
MEPIFLQVEQSLSSSIVDISQAFGGSVSDSRLITLDNGQRFFLKIDQSTEPSIGAEADGLRRLRESGSIRTPKIISEDKHYLVLEYISPGSLDRADFKALGTQLARLHKNSHQYWGLDRNNFIGSTLQINDQCRDRTWAQFFLKARLGPQIYWLRKRGLWPADLQSLEDQLVSVVESLLSEQSDLRPSLLHGDLWSGNVLWDKQGSPILIDPAIYWGHREADLSLAILFGGFSDDFFRAYDEEWPREPGFEARVQIYILYHLLNHVNIFGSAYLTQTRKLIKSLISEQGGH